MRGEPVYTETVTETVTAEREEQQAETEETNSTVRVSWSDDVVDNEFLGRKKSKVCCIYRKNSKECPECDSDSDGPNDYEKA
ncbi:MAG: uncharacterized protein A8A55_0509 [Amphiamblys sp. WSBS2006]|nr:MAG: uncharacterized protein A8A55_0509 [Amphiamblys sp. WSBS2006]